MKPQAFLLSTLLVVSIVGAAAAPAASQQASGEAYSGTHVEFDSEGEAVTDYSVDGDVVLENVTMRSESEAREAADDGVGLGVGVDLPAAAIESRSAVAAGVSLRFASGGELRANDNRHGVAQFRADDDAQVVTAELAGDAEAETESDERVVVTTEDGTQGAFIVVGDGNVTAENGSVNAVIESDSQLVYRQYDDERTEADRKQERLIQNGTATAEVFVRSTVESGVEDAPETTTTTPTATGRATDTPTATATATPTDSPTATTEGNATSVVTYDQDT